MPEAIDHERILALFRDGSPDERAAFVRACPPHPLRDGAATLSQADDVIHRLMALGILTTAYCYGRACEIGAEIAIAGHALGTEALRGGRADLQPATLSGLAAGAVNALRVLGRNQEALELCDRLLPYHEALDATDLNVHSLRMARVEILLDLDRVDEAEAAFNSAPAPAGAAALAAPLLKKRIEAAKKPPTELPEGAAPVPTPEQLEVARRALELAKLVGAQLGEGSELNELEANARIRSASSILLDPVAGNDPAKLQASVAALRSVREFTKDHASPQVDCDALWPLAICLGRLRRYEEAVEAIQALRAHVEDLRARIRDPMERAGAGSTFPYLYPSLCQHLTRLRRPEELLDAMEGAKGRAVADVLVGRSQQTVDDRDLSRPAAALPGLLRREAAHYLSFFVDDEETYAVLVAKDGSLHAAPAIPLGRAAIRAAAAAVAPSGGAWELPRALAPLLSWLEPLQDAGVIEDGDHLAWSPDESLHEIPLHAVEFRGAPAVEYFGISRAHGARALVLLLEHAAARPARHVSIEVPAQEDVGSRTMLSLLARVGDWLAAGDLPGERIRGEEASLERLAATDLSHALVHFAAHGTFPESGEDGPLANPFRGSGLLLAHGGRLPDRERVWTTGGGTAFVLTPERILATGLDLSGSHVSLGACVSGLAREGVGGDALGLDWAFVLAGAASLLSTHWAVEARHAAEFMERFYDAWLRRGLSRGAAWREVVLRLRKEPDALGSPRCWAAFTLSGDWR